MRALHRIGAGELPSAPERAGFFAQTRWAAPTIRGCRDLQTKPCGQLYDPAKCNPHILRPGRGTDGDRCDETSLAILLPTPVRRLTVDPHSARVLSLRRRAASTPNSYILTPHLILCDGALRAYRRAVIPCQQSLHHHQNKGRTCAMCRSCHLARPPSRSPSAPSPGQASPVNECREKPQTYIADVISGLPGMGWAISFWYDEETGLDQLTARLQQQLRPVPSALHGTLPWGGLRLRLDRYVRLRAIAQQLGSQFSTCAHQRCPRWLVHCHCPTRWTGSTAESNPGSRSLIHRLCGPFAAHACHPLPSATARAHVALSSSHSFDRRVCRLANGKARPNHYSAFFLHLTTLEQTPWNLTLPIHAQRTSRIASTCNSTS